MIESTNGVASVVVLSLEEYDIYCVPQLEAELAQLSGVSCVVDFSRVRYLDSTCLGALIRTFKRLRLNYSCDTITLRNMTPHVKKIFEITALNTIFAIE